jgi:hypothetical protein
MGIVMAQLRFSTASLLACLFGTATSILSAQTLTTADIASRAGPATVTILVIGSEGDTTGLGSGFLVKSSGVIVTNWHVMAGASRAAVRLSTGELFERVEALDGDEAADLAILKIPGYGMATVEPEASLPAVGSKLVVIGSPLGLTQTVSEGIVSARRLQDGRELLQMTVPISPGSSGGPVLNTAGRVVAVATKYMAKGQQLNFAVPVRYAMGLVEGASDARPLQAVFGGSSMSPQHAGSRAPEAPAIGPRTSTLPPAAASPRPSLLGSYRGVMHTNFTEKNGSKRSFTDTIQVHIAGEDDGVVLVEQNASRAKAFVFPVITGSTTSDGRIVLDMGLAPMDGYQTDRGLLAVGKRTRENGEKIETALLVERAVPDLTARTGLYRLSSRTEYKNRHGVTGGIMEWFGYAAVAVVRDSAFIDIRLENDQGGSTGGFFAGRVRDGRFRAKIGDEHPNVLEITFYAGRFQGRWTDYRDTGSAYDGTIEGRRE